MTVKRVRILPLVNHDDIPAGFLRKRPPDRGILDSINGDDGTIKAVERVMSGGELLSQAGNADGIQTYERDQEPAPQFLLKLRQHTGHRNDQDPLSASSPDQFRNQDAGLQCLSRAGAVGNQNAGPRALQGRLPLVQKHIHRSPVSGIEMITDLFFGIFGTENGSLCTTKGLPRICSSFLFGTNCHQNHSPFC